MLPQLILNIAVVVKPDRDSGIVYQCLFPRQFLEDVVMDNIAELLPARSFSPISNGKALWIVPVLLRPFEELTPLQAKQLHSVRSAQLLRQVFLHYHLRLLVAQPFVNLLADRALPFMINDGRDSITECGFKT